MMTGHLPAPWVTRLTCPACGTPEALLLFDGVGTVCIECGDTVHVLVDETGET